MSLSARIAALLLAAAPLAACSFDAFTYTVDRYGTITGRHVHLSCRDTYEVFDRPPRSLLVVTNALNEGLARTCPGGALALPLAERMRRAAEIYLAETAGRPECTIVRQDEISAFHAEFRYRCPSAEPPPSTTRRGRG